MISYIGRKRKEDKHKNQKLIKNDFNNERHIIIHDCDL